MTARRATLRVRFAELDPYDHVNHSVYVTYFEVGRVEAMAAVGIDLSRLQADGWQLVVVELNVRYRAPASGRDELVVETGLAELAGASSRWRQRLLRCADDRVLCTADVRIAVTDRAGRPRRLPAELRAQLEELSLGDGGAGTGAAAGGRPASVEG